VKLKLHCTSKLLPAKGNVKVFTFASSAVLYGVCARREQDGGVSPVRLRLLDSPPQRSQRGRTGNMQLAILGRKVAKLLVYGGLSDGHRACMKYV